MLGFRIVFHALHMLFHDLWATFRLTVLPWILGLGLAGMVFLGLTHVRPEDFQIQIRDISVIDTGFFIALALALAIILATFCWVAVGWHRYALLNEAPGVLLPRLNGNRIAGYFAALVKLLFVSLALLVPALSVFGMAMSLIGGPGPLSLLLSAIVVAVITVFLLRLSLILPAAALGRPITLPQALAATRGLFWPLFVVTLLLTLLSNLAEAQIGNGLLSITIDLFLSWLNMALGIAVLTTLYGLRVEGRSLT